MTPMLNGSARILMCACLAAMSCGAVGAAAAERVYRETFSGQQNGAAPVSGSTQWFVAAHPNSTVTVSTAEGNPAPALTLVDSSVSGSEAGRAEINLGSQAMGRFDTRNAGSEVLTFGFDIKVDAFTAPNDGHGSTPRVTLKNGNRHFVVGFGRASVPDGDGGGDLFLFAAEGGDTGQPAVVVPRAENAIGFAGGRWAEGFNFGNVNSTPSENGTRGEWYRIELTFTADSTDVAVKATNVATGQSATATRPVSAPFTFSSVGTDGIAVLAPGAGTATFHVDNLSLDVRGK